MLAGDTLGALDTLARLGVVVGAGDQGAGDGRGGEQDEGNQGTGGDDSGALAQRSHQSDQPFGDDQADAFDREPGRPLERLEGVGGAVEHRSQLAVVGDDDR